jgi:hypothetical protein
MPIAGTIAWAIAGVLGALLPSVEAASYALFICTGSILPLGLFIARFTGEDLMGKKSSNELDRLFGLTVLMANLVWAIAIPFWLLVPSSLPLSVGVLAGLMWVPFSWMIGHWVGMFHAIARTILVLVVWIAWPDHRFVAVPVVVVAVYLVTIVALARRPR